MEDDDLENFPNFKSVTGKLTVVRKRKRNRENAQSAQTFCPSSRAGAVKSSAAEGSKNPFKVSRSKRLLPTDVERDASSRLSIDAQKIDDHFIHSSVAGGTHSTSPAFTTITGGADRGIESPCQFIPGTPEKSHSDSFVIPKTPEAAPHQRIRRAHAAIRFRRIPLTEENYCLPRNEIATECSSSPLLQNSLANLESSDLEGVLPQASPHAVDYSLYNHVRLSSRRNLIDLTTSNGDVESRALQGFISDTQDQTMSSQEFFHMYLHYYAYPNLPWLTLFPRTFTERQNDDSVPRCSYPVLHSEWKTALQSAFESLLYNRLSCKFFYVMCERFNVLYSRCGGCQSVSAIVTPTSRGFRHNLGERGIQYLMPYEISDNTDKDAVLPDESLPEGQQHNSGCAGPELNTSVKEDDDPLRWLQDIGIDEAEFPSLRAARTQMEQEGFRRLDYLPASTVSVSGEDNLRKLGELIVEVATATTGQLAHIPPTIFSRSPFLRASIQKLSHNVGQLTSDAGVREWYLDLKGPVLPGVTTDLVKDVLQTQGFSSERRSKVDNTEALNAPKPCKGGCVMTSHTAVTRLA